MAKPFFMFSGLSSAGSDVIWLSDGTAAGTLELTPSGPLTDPTGFTQIGKSVVFAAYNGTYIGLWVTDGTSTGTKELTNIPGASPSGLYPANFVAFNGAVYFSGTDANGQIGLWKTDGTAAGTTEITGIPDALTGTSTTTGQQGLNPQNLTVFNGKLYFSGNDVNSQINLWVSDGTAQGTAELPAVGESPTGLYPSELTVFAGRLYFLGADAHTASSPYPGDLGLWSTDGTAADTTEITYSVNHGAGFGMTVFGNQMAYFGPGADGTDEFSLVSANGTVVPFGGANSTLIDVYPESMTALGNKLLIAGDTGEDSNLYVSDGSEAGTSVLNVANEQIDPYTMQPDLDPGNLTTIGNVAYFAGYDASGKSQLWVTDGTANGTTELLVPGSGNQYNGIGPADIVAVNLPDVACYTNPP